MWLLLHMRGVKYGPAHFLSMQQKIFISKHNNIRLLRKLTVSCAAPQENGGSKPFFEKPIEPSPKP